MNKKSYFLNLILILTVVVLVFMFFGGDILWILDLASILIILVLSLSSLLMNNGIRDFARCHKLAFSRETSEKESLDKAINLFSALRSNLMAAGIVGAAMGLIIMLGNLSDTSHIGPALATTLITMLYSFLLQLIWVNPLLTALKDRKVTQA
jgi:flagellar motor component MotA